MTCRWLPRGRLRHPVFEEVCNELGLLAWKAAPPEDGGRCTSVDLF